MDIYAPLCFPPIFSNRERFKENPRGQGYCNSHYFNMAAVTLITSALENEHKKSDLTSNQKHPSDGALRDNSPAHRIGELKTSGMVDFKQRMEAEGRSEKATKLITNARRAGTQARYKFVTNVLADLFKTGLEYRTLNSYICFSQQWRLSSNRQAPISNLSYERNR